MGEFANANQQAEGAGFLSARLNEFAPRLSDAQKALYLSAIGSLRAQHASSISLAPGTDGQNSANHILINTSSERQVDPLGNLGASPGRIALFHLDDSGNHVLRRTFRSWLCSSLW